MGADLPSWTFLEAESARVLRYYIAVLYCSLSPLDFGADLPGWEVSDFEVSRACAAMRGMSRVLPCMCMSTNLEQCGHGADQEPGLLMY